MSAKSALREKIQAMLLGVGIGDALGYPVEGMSPERIAAAYPVGRITKFIPAIARRWYKGEPAGTTSDDTQLTLAVLSAFVKSPLNVHAQMHSHIAAYKDSTNGWGSSTRNAVEALMKGEPSGQSGPRMGKGNACAMKISPLAASLTGRLKLVPDDQERQNNIIRQTIGFAVRLSLLTHYTLMAVESAVVQISALSYCLNPFCDYGAGNEFDPLTFLDILDKSFSFAKDAVVGIADIDRESFQEQMKKVCDYGQYQNDIPRLRADFGGCSCYIAHSLPATYAVFLNNPFSIESLYDIIMVGGDTDTNGSMLAALLGALNGPQIFPQHLVDGLVGKDKILDAANQLCDSIGI